MFQLWLQSFPQVLSKNSEQGTYQSKQENILRENMNIKGKSDTKKGVTTRKRASGILLLMPKRKTVVALILTESNIIITIKKNSGKF